METQSLSQVVTVWSFYWVASLLGSGINGNERFSLRTATIFIVASLLGSGINGNYFLLFQSLRWQFV